MVKRQASLLSFCHTHKRQMRSEEKGDDDHDQDSDDSDCQNLQVDDRPEESHDPSCMMSTLSPKIFG